MKIMQLDPAVLSATTQALYYTALSNLFAQGWTAYQKQSLSTLNPTAFIHFLIFTASVTPPNYWWQKWLEDSFPTRVSSYRTQKRDNDAKSTDEEFSVANTITKFILDQSIGCWINTFAFMTIMPILKGQAPAEITWTLQHEFWSMVIASYSFWPLVCITNLILVPFEYRALVGNTAALVWGIHVALITG